MMRADEDFEDPKKPKPVTNRKKGTSRYELLETDGRAKLKADDLDRHQHV